MAAGRYSREACNDWRNDPGGLRTVESPVPLQKRKHTSAPIEWEIRTNLGAAKRLGCELVVQDWYRPFFIDTFFVEVSIPGFPLKSTLFVSKKIDTFCVDFRNEKNVR